MYRFVAMIAGLAVSVVSHAATLQDLYADMDAKIMASNSSVYSMYAADAPVVFHTGQVTKPEALRFVMNELIRKGIKYEAHQSTILSTHEIRSGVMKNLMGVIVVSEDFVRLSAPDEKDQNKKSFEEMKFITTRVFDASNPQKWIIVSEQSTPVAQPKK